MFWSLKANYKKNENIFKISGVLPIPNIIPIDYNLDYDSIELKVDGKKVDKKVEYVEAYYH